MSETKCTPECSEYPYHDWEKEFETQFAGSAGYVNPHFSQLIKEFFRQTLAAALAEQRGKTRKEIVSNYVIITNNEIDNAGIDQLQEISERNGGNKMIQTILSLPSLSKEK